MSGFSGIETNNKLDKLKLELEREMLKIVYDSYKNGYEEGALKMRPAQWKLCRSRRCRA